MTVVTERSPVVELLVRAGVPQGVAGPVAERLGPGAADLLRADPWRLLDADGPQVVDADRLAFAVLPARPDRSDPRRGRAVVSFVLARAARDGHTAMATDAILAAVSGAGVSEPPAAVEAALDDGRVVDAGDGLLALTRLAIAEDMVAEGVARLLATADPIAAREAAGAVAASLDQRQRTAVEHVLEHGVTVLTGGPGTGKSRTIAAVVRLVRARGRTVALAAPTGRAAKRLEELTGHEAVTLHRLLGAQGRTNEFARGEAWPLDEDVVVVDEASMLDVELAAALVDACADGTHVLLVGDPAQLPSIGAGRVLGDLVDAGVVPAVELSTLYRQEDGGAIARLATAVRAGALPPPDELKTDDREVVLVRAADSGEAARRVVQLVTDSIPRVLGIPPDEVQVVTSVHRGPAGTVALNAALKAALNPGAGEAGGFDVGDRVVAVANRPEARFANGEVGVVTGVEPGGALVVAFAAGAVTVPSRLAADLRHGWAITVHRAQGSEWPAVVSVLPAESGGLLSRPLVYTAFTRAQRHLSVVHAAGPLLAHAVREVGARPRRTRLRTLLAGAAADFAPVGTTGSA